MADTNRTAAYDLIQALRLEPYRFDFLQAMRLIECAHFDKPRLGTSSRAVDDAVRLGQEPDMKFAPAALSGLIPGRDGRPDRLVVRFCGLFGPNRSLALAPDRIRLRTAPPSR